MAQRIAEIEIAISGIGGQGIQLLAKVLARAALADGLNAMLTSEYGGEMRGGRSSATVVLGTEPIRALPVVEQAGCAIALHHLHWSAVEKLLVPGALVVSESEVQSAICAMEGAQRLRHIAVPAKEAALQAGNVMAAGLALLGGFCSLTGIVQIDSLCAAMADAIPPYRKQHIATNERALRAGAASVANMSASLNPDVDRRFVS